VLLLGFGYGTRVLEFVSDDIKTYRATFHLGVSTDTYDGEGEITGQGGVEGLSEGEIEDGMGRFRGGIEQIPPMYSALKHGGQPLYKLARAGYEIVRPPRKVDIKRLVLLDWEPPLAAVEITCSKGTYIRSLAHDIGQALGCGAYLSQLVRLQVGRFHIRSAWRLDEAEQAFENGHGERLLYSLDAPLISWKAAILGGEGEKAVLNGRSIPLDDGTRWEDGAWCRAYSRQGMLLALLKYRAESSNWRPQKVFPYEIEPDQPRSLDISGKLGMIQETYLKEASMDAYCMKCRDKREIQGAKQVTLKNGRPAVEGTCGTCGTKLFRIGKM
jgi:tRNA pseudouridine55 synthase